VARYRKLSKYLKERYGVRIQKIPIFAGFTCPNRLLGEPCIYCDPTGSGFSTFMNLPIRQQVLEWKERFRKKYKNVKFIAYFQAFSNTFAPVEDLKKKYEEALDEDIVALDISTRPDLLQEDILDLLEEFKRKVDVFLDVGLQTVNYKTLKILQRHHTLAEFIDGVIRAKKRGFEVTVHVIANLPWDDIDDVVETAKVLSALGVEGVKLHSLYVVKGTKLAEMYKKGEVKIGGLEEYIERVVTFLEYLDPSIVIHRLASDPPRDGVIFGNWGLSKMEIIRKIEEELERRDTWQGKKFDYLKRNSINDVISSIRKVKMQG
jgi:radical SAM protein (TIGR01212 family)